MKPTINNRETRTKRETRRSEDADSNCDSLCDCVRMKTRLSGGRSQRSVFDELRSQSGAGPPAHRGGSAVRQDARQEDPRRPPAPPSAPQRPGSLSWAQDRPNPAWDHTPDQLEAWRWFRDFWLRIRIKTKKETRKMTLASIIVLTAEKCPERDERFDAKLA